MSDVVVYGNVTLDVICHPVDDVPRDESIGFKYVCVSPGGCGSNVAIGLASQGISVALVARIGQDDSANLLNSYWESVGISLEYLHSIPEYPTGVSVGLVDRQAQPRFIHTPGANTALVAADLDGERFLRDGARYLHIAGYFVLPSILNLEFATQLQEAHHAGLHTSMDVVRSPAMFQPDLLWKCLPWLDVFFCNAQEGQILTGLSDHRRAASELHQRGAKNVIIKLGEQGCWLESDLFQGVIPTQSVPVVDTTGAGDAFAAGYLTARVQGADERESCQAGNAAGSKVVQSLGAVSAWVSPSDLTGAR